jgi:hypothetical protein
MSDDEQGSDPSGFLKRWSQRKLEAKEPQRETALVQVDVPPVDVSEEVTVEEFDLSSLPKVEDLTAMTDIRMFLQKGVPESLRNAALRKAWALDPAIRRYVSPALEYAYDWNTPGGVPGTSDLAPGLDVARLVSQIMGGDQTAAQEPISVQHGQEEQAEASQDDAMQQPAAGQPTGTIRLSEVNPMEQTAVSALHPNAADRRDADQQDSDRAAAQPPVRRHGSAKPPD